MSNKLVKKSKEDDGKIVDVIIPAYKAQHTIIRTLSSIAEQTIREKLTVTIVNDGDPEGKDYSDYISMFEKFLDIKEIKLPENAGPGVARQKGIEATDHKYFTCIDADDTFYGTMALEGLVKCMESSEVVQCVSGVFLQLSDDVQKVLPHQNDMVWMFGKLYKRKFIEKYKIKFNDTRANEDTGYNKWVQLLCDNQMEQINFTGTAVYCWHNKPDSITRINDGQYALDQCFCGWTDNMIYAITNAKKSRPFSGTITQNIVGIMLNLYYYYIETVAKKPVFAKQNWEYVKKFYDTCYKKIEEDITDEVLSEMFSVASMEKWGSGSLIGVVPAMGIKEFFDALHNDPYDPDHIYDVWEEMQKDEETRELMQNNITCGVCGEGYFLRPEDKKKDESDEKDYAETDTTDETHDDPNEEIPEEIKNLAEAIASDE